MYLYMTNERVFYEFSAIKNVRHPLDVHHTCLFLFCFSNQVPKMEQRGNVGKSISIATNPL